MVKYGDRFMAEKLLDISTLPEYVMTLTTSKMVRVSESNKVITIEPIEENEYKCPLLDVAVGSKRNR